MRFGNWGPAMGAVSFQSGYNRYAQQMKMHQLAKDQALAQYYSKLENSINPAGVRQQDMEGWQNKLQEWQRFGVENRSALVNPNMDRGQSQRRFMAMHQDLLGDIQKSKAAATNERAVQQHMIDPKWRAMTTNKDMELAHKMSMSIYHPEHYKEDGVTPVSPEDFSFNAPPFDINKQKAIATLATRGLKRDRTFGKATGVDPETRLTRVPYTEQHSPQNLKTIAERTGQAYDGDKSMQQFFDNRKLEPDEHDRMNKAFQSVYGKDQSIDDPDKGADPRKVAMAAAIVDNSQQSTGSELRSVSRPPVGRALTKAQQDQQLMLGLTNQMAAAIKRGDVGEAKRLGGAWFSGNGKSNYQDIDQGSLVQTGNMAGLHPKQGFVISHVDKQWVPDKTDPSKGSYQDVLNKTELDPDDPQLINKIANIHQKFMGSTPALEKGVIGQTLNPSAPPAPKVVTPSVPKPKTDPLGIFNN